MNGLGVKGAALTGITDLQKASLWKRISAALFDFILLGIVIIGSATIFSSVFGYDAYSNTFTAKCEEYSQKHGVELPVTKETYDKMSQEDQKNYMAAQKELNADADAVRAYNMTQHLPLLIVTLGTLVGVLFMEVAIPLLFDNGQTLGKKIFGVALMRIDGIKLSHFQLFTRSVLGKFTIELMIPIYVFIMIWLGKGGIFGLAMLLLLLTSQILCLVITRTGSLLHDVLAGTVAVDMASQMIFETKEAQLQYIKEKHAKKAAESTY